MGHGSAVKTVAWQLRLQNLPEMVGLWFSVEGCCPAYRSQRNGKTQQEGSEHEANPIGFSEGSPDPSYRCEEDCQRDV